MRTWSLLAASTAVLISAGAASAQSLMPDQGFGAPDFFGRSKNTSVLERPRPDYEALGLHTGGFTIFPRITVTGVYDDNVFAARSGAKSDFSVLVHPEVKIRSDWGRHALDFAFGMKNTSFTKYSSENETGYDARVDSRIDVHGESALFLGAEAEHAFEPRGSETTFTGGGTEREAHPVAYDSEAAYIRGVYTQDRVRATLEGVYHNYTFADVGLVDATTGIPKGVTVDEQARDYSLATGGGRIDYALTPDEAVFAKVEGSSLTYQNFDGLNDPKRNSTGVRALAGATFDITSLTRGEVGVGYVTRNYASSVYKSISGVSVAAKVDYFPTQLLTLTLHATRAVQDSSFTPKSGGYFQNRVDLEGDYELSRNIILSAAAGYERDDYSGVVRNDNLWDIKAQGRYFLTRAVGVGLSVAHTEHQSSAQFSTDIGPIYNDTRVALSLVFQR